MSRQGDLQIIALIPGRLASKPKAWAASPRRLLLSLLPSLKRHHSSACFLVCSHSTWCGVIWRHFHRSLQGFTWSPSALMSHHTPPHPHLASSGSLDGFISTSISYTHKWFCVSCVFYAGFCLWNRGTTNERMLYSSCLIHQSLSGCIHFPVDDVTLFSLVVERIGHHSK